LIAAKTAINTISIWHTRLQGIGMWIASMTNHRMMASSASSQVDREGDDAHAALSPVCIFRSFLRMLLYANPEATPSKKISAAGRDLNPFCASCTAAAPTAVPPREAQGAVGFPMGGGLRPRLNPRCRVVPSVPDARPHESILCVNFTRHNSAHALQRQAGYRKSVDYCMTNSSRNSCMQTGLCRM
jgi:hypothetical protein